MQKVRVNKLAMSDFAKRALKRATKWYARERNIPGGLSSYQIEKKVKLEYSGVGPNASTIRRYVNANLQGMSPLKIVVKGDIPRWTTHANISSWFDNWEFDLVDLGFAVRAADGKVTILDEQLHFINNFNKTCLSLDGTEGRRGGRPEITLHDPRLPYNGKRSNKDSLTATLVCGSNAAGEALPPHFQFQTKATTEEGQRIRNEVFAHVVSVRGQFGHDEEKDFDVTFGLNTKGGMDDQAFFEYKK